jgi:hypothetical protein
MASASALLMLAPAAIPLTIGGMPYFHVVATLGGGSVKTVTNKSEVQVLTNFVVPFITAGNHHHELGQRRQS